MATMLPQQHPPSSRSTHSFAPGSPPDRALFHQQQQENPSTPPLNYRSSLEFRRRSGPGFANSNSALPPPHGSQPMPNGGSRHKGTMSLGAFEGGKSPPSTKSGPLPPGHVCTIADLSTQTLLMSPASFSGPVNVKQDQLAPSHILPISQRLIHGVNTSLKYARTATICRSMRLALADFSRATANSGRSAPWPMFYLMEESSIDQTVS